MSVRRLVVGLALMLLVTLAPCASAGRTYSSGRSSSVSSSRPSTSGRSYSSGSRTSTPSRSSPSPAARAPTSAPRPTAPTYSRPAGKSYTAGPSPAPHPPSGTGPSHPFGGSTRPNVPRGPSYTPTPSSPHVDTSRRAGGAFDAAAGAAQKRAESKKAYVAGKQPKPNYTDTTGTAKPIPRDDRRAEDLRRQLDHERWVNRELRQRRVFGPYYSYPVVVYHDPYSSWFWWWLLSRDLDTRARWAYHHRDDMDPARYRELLTRDAQLEERIRQLEAQQASRDPAYAPKELDPDLMYTDEYADAVYNPQPADPAAPPYVPPVVTAPPFSLPPVRSISASTYFWGGIIFLVKALLVLAGMVFLIWLVFYKRWGGT